MRIVGRERELEQVRRFLRGVPSGLSALHLQGEAGIGKSTLWQVAIATAAELGYRVISTRPTEAEARLPFAALHDLVGDLLDEVRPELAPPQQYALDVALLRRESAGTPPEPLAISLAVLTVLRTAAAEQTLVIAIDDVPWIDPSTASVLEFAFRRLDDATVGVLASERTGVGSVEGVQPLGAIPVERVSRISVAPLTVAETEVLLSSALGQDLPPRWLSRIHRTSGGNPLFAVELGRAVLQRGPNIVDDGMPLPETLAGLVRDRVAGLPAAAQTVVSYASALSQPTAAALREAIGEQAMHGLTEAVSTGVLTTEGATVRFSHPLLAAEAYSRMDPSNRREVHRRLADIVTEPEEHARHLALAIDVPDEGVARELEAAAVGAYERGAPDAAADLVERAIALTPEGDARRWHRDALAGRYRWMAGDPGRAIAGLKAALGDAPTGRARAEILLWLGNVEELQGDWRAASRRFLSALGEKHDDVRLLIDIKLAIAGACHITGQDWQLGWQHATDAMRLAEELGDSEVLAATVGHYATWHYLTGHGYPGDLEERAAALEPWTAPLRTLDHPDFDFALMRASEGDLEGMRVLHERLLTRADHIGDYSSLTFILANLALADFAQGRLKQAGERIDRADRIAGATGQRTAQAHVLSVRTTILGRQGDVEAAWSNGRAALELITETGWAQGEASVRVELALLELSLRNPEAADAVLASSLDIPLSHGAYAWVAPMRAEVLLALGRPAEAAAVLRQFDNDPRVKAVPLFRANRDAAAALLAAAKGHTAEATRLVGSALSAFDADTDRWVQAKARMIAGEVHRRARRRAKARAAFEQAMATFQALGCTLWADRAGEQLAKIGGSSTGPAGLTPTQLQIAELVTGGLTNREVGDRLFMSPHTVEAHLTATYRKLGIRSRVELGSALGSAGRGSRDSATDSRDSDV